MTDKYQSATPSQFGMVPLFIKQMVNKLDDVDRLLKIKVISDKCNQKETKGINEQAVHKTQKVGW